MGVKPRILVVSYNIPRPDKSSGELRFTAILKILSEFWEIDFCIADSHIEYNTSSDFIPYSEKLKKEGIRVLPVKQGIFLEAIKENHYVGGYFNLYWIAEEMMPKFRLALPGAFTIVDSVDVHFAREETQARLGEIDATKVEQTKKKELGVYKSADVTIAVSKDDYYLLKEVERVGNVILIPNIVQTHRRNPGDRKPIVFFIGCYAWYPNPDAVKWFASQIWPQVIKAVPSAEFLIIGSDPTEEVLALADNPGIKVVGYVPETKPYLEMAAVSVAPLRFGGGMKGKVNEAMAHGIPVVATSIGAQGFEATHGKQIMIADDPDEFARSVIALLQDQRLQQEVGLGGQKLNSAICSPEAVKKNIEELVEFCTTLSHKPKKRTLCLWFHSRCATISSFFKDIGFGLELLKREGFGQFVRRSILYLQGQRLPEEVQQQHQAILEFPPQPETPLFSIIIPVYNQWEYSFDCLASILKNSIDISYEIIIADDFSTDDTRFSDQFVKNVRVIRNETNKGFLANCNDAAKQAKGAYIILLNNDTLVQPEWLTWFAKTLEEKPEVGMVGAKLVFSTGKLQEAGGIVFQDGSAMNYGREDDPDRPQYNYLKDVDYCSGACICVRRDLWNQLGGFDTQYAPAYYEDTDLAMQIRAAGYRTVFQPKSVVIHLEGISHGTDITQGIKKKQDENQHVFYSKWKDVLKKDNFLRDENLFRARDKSKHRQTVLLIGETSAKMINRFVEPGFNIKYLPDDFLRPEPETSEMEQMGIEVLYGEWYKQNWLQWVTENAENIDSVSFVDESLEKKYLPELQPILNENPHIVVK